jgi:hypothetical protein
VSEDAYKASAGEVADEEISAPDGFITECIDEALDLITASKAERDGDELDPITAARRSNVARHRIARLYVPLAATSRYVPEPLLSRMSRVTRQYLWQVSEQANLASRSGSSATSRSASSRKAKATSRSASSRKAKARSRPRVEFDHREFSAAINTAGKLREQVRRIASYLLRTSDAPEEDAPWIDAHVGNAAAQVERWLIEVAADERKHKVRPRPNAALHTWIGALRAVWRRAGLRTGTRETDLFARFVITLHALVQPKAKALSAGKVHHALRSL